MQLEFEKIEEASGLANQLIEHHPHAIFLANSDFKIQYFNKAFKKLSESDKADILGHEFCEVIGCTRRGTAVTRKDNFCKKCQMRELLSGANLSELTLVRDFFINNKSVTKHLHIDTHKIVMHDEKYRLVVIEDQTQQH